MHLTIDELRAFLKLWGREYGERSMDFEDLDRDSPDVHPLAVARHFAPGSRAAVALAARRDGSSRRKRMAEGLKSEEGHGCGLRLVPTWAVDPVPNAGASRGGGGSPRAVPPQVLAIQSAVMRMIDDADPERGARPWGLALQAQYCIRGALSDKADWTAHHLGKAVSVRSFRALVEQGTYVLLGKLLA